MKLLRILHMISVALEVVLRVEVCLFCNLISYVSFSQNTQKKGIGACRVWGTESTVISVYKNVILKPIISYIENTRLQMELERSIFLRLEF